MSQNQQIVLGKMTIELLPHPDDPQQGYIIEGEESHVYKVREVHNGQYAALKIAYSDDSGPRWQQTAQVLRTLPDIPGLYLKRRYCLTRQTHPSALKRHPVLENALLMPWIEGMTWQELMHNKEASKRYSFRDALILAQNTASVLWTLEQYGLAHGDLAGDNIIINPDWQNIQLIDLEDMYLADQAVTAARDFEGSPGYQHRNAGPAGYHYPAGDRFAGAILLTEMLCWWHPHMHTLLSTEGRGFFHPNELQILKTERWKVVREILWSIDEELKEIFDYAWVSSNLDTCPSIEQWLLTLTNVIERYASPSE